MSHTPYKIIIYQHAPKCGGRSFIKACRGYFNVVSDRPPPFPTKEQVEAFAKTKIDFSKRRLPLLVHGHLVFDGIRPAQRYASELKQEGVGLITVVRDPLERALSAYFHRRKKGKTWEGGLEDWLQQRQNNICGYLGIKMVGDKPDSDPFLMIGVTEQLQESHKVFARLVGMPPAEIERINTSERDPIDLPASLLKEFRKNNAMDYALHQYAKRRLAAQIKAL